MSRFAIINPYDATFFCNKYKTLCMRVCVCACVRAFVHVCVHACVCSSQVAQLEYQPGN